MPHKFGMPQILCTPWLVWFLEHADRHAVLPLLEPGESTVGVVVNVEHASIAADKPSFAAIVDHASDFGLQLCSSHDAIDESMLQQELTGLKPFGQLDADGRFDGTRPSKADQRLRFGEHDVAQRRETGGDAAHRRIGQYGNKQTGRVVDNEPAQRRLSPSASATESPHAFWHRRPSR